MKNANLDHLSSSQIVIEQTALADDVWHDLRRAAAMREGVPAPLAAMISTIVTDSAWMGEGLARVLARQTLDSYVGEAQLSALFLSIYRDAPALVAQAAADLRAVTERDPAATDLLVPFLYFKGYHALQTHRAAHALWQVGQTDMALFLQNRSSVLYGVDIHPAATIGAGVMIDHATGIVIGETAVVEDNVSLLHNVTLGGTGKTRGDRHPKVRQGVMIGAGATLLGNIEIGAGACIAAGSMVLDPVAPHTTVVGVPARPVGKPKSDAPAREMDQTLAGTL